LLLVVVVVVQGIEEAVAVRVDLELQQDFRFRQELDTQSQSELAGQAVQRIAQAEVILFLAR
jgi:hypothetical protein